MATFAGTSADDFIFPTANGVDYRGGQGNDTYIISSLIPANALISIIDTEGTNRIQLADGLSIASSNFLANAVEILLSNGAKIRILGAAHFAYAVGANATAVDVADPTNALATRPAPAHASRSPRAAGAARTAGCRRGCSSRPRSAYPGAP